MILFLIKSSYISIRQINQKCSTWLTWLYLKKLVKLVLILKLNSIFRKIHFFRLRPVMPSIQFDWWHAFNFTNFILDKLDHHAFSFITLYLYLCWTYLSMCFCNLERAHKSTAKTVNKIVFLLTQTPTLILQ